MTDVEIRAAAMQAATRWLAGVDPYPQGRTFVLETAELFAAWIENGGQQQ